MNMRHPSTDPSQLDLIDQAGKAYRKTLARWGLADLSAGELDQARTNLQSTDRSEASTETVEFQAALTRLGSKHLPPQKVEEAMRELLSAEYDCDQAEWERDCHHAAMMTHMQTRIVPRLPIMPPA
jgi:hypothetical protein